LDAGKGKKKTGGTKSNAGDEQAALRAQFALASADDGGDVTLTALSARHVDWTVLDDNDEGEDYSLGAWLRAEEQEKTALLIRQEKDISALL
jgi:hypothetical protein